MAIASTTSPPDTGPPNTGQPDSVARDTSTAGDTDTAVPVEQQSESDSALPLSRRVRRRRSAGSLGRRMVGVAALWILVLLTGGGLALDRVLVTAITRNFDSGLEYVLFAMIRSSEIDPTGEVRLIQPLGDQRFLEPYSGLYWQISGAGHEPFPSRSLWDRQLVADRAHPDDETHTYDTAAFPDETLRIVERDVLLPGSRVRWRYQIAQNRVTLDEQIRTVRRTLVRSFAILGLGLIVMAALQSIYGLWPLRRIQSALGEMRRGERSRVTARLPDEVMPMVEELNALIAHNEAQAEEARRHAGNLAHALKTPLTVITSAAADPNSGDLADTVAREAATMRRQIDHHLARARAVGRRAAGQSRAQACESVEAVERAVARLYPEVRVDSVCPNDIWVRVERQDLEEMLGNLVDNAAKYGGGSVFVTVEARGDLAEFLIEDDGNGIAVADRSQLFDRGARLDTDKPGTGLGLAIVRDVAEIYGGRVTLEASEDLGGLLARLSLPLAQTTELLESDG